MNKEYIINLLEKGEFTDFLQNDREGNVLKLLDKEGIEILNNSKRKSNRIGYILTFSPYKYDLLNNIDFIDAILSSKISDYYSAFKSLDSKTCERIFKRALETNVPIETTSRLFTFFSTEAKLEILKENKLNQDLIITIFNKSYDSRIIQTILDTYTLDLTNPKINVRLLFEKGRETFLKKDDERPNITIPNYMITKDLASMLWEENNIFMYRRLINDAQHSTDASVLNTYAKNQEDKIISTSQTSELISPFDRIYELFKIIEIQKYNYLHDVLNYDSKLEEDSYKEYIKLCDITEIRNLDGLIKNIMLKGKENDVFNLLKKYSSEKLSNYIIDYHFEENYYNIMLDMNELLQYYYDGNIVINKERLELYEQLVNLDLLSNEEKYNLHNKLKNYNMMAIFYDDMRMAKDKVAEDIKEYSLDIESIQKYKNEELSKEYGIPVYVMDGDPFFGIVKTGRRAEDYYPTGHSYSLIGDKGLNVFGNPDKANTYLYDASLLNKEQVVHVFPTDSYTLYQPFHYRGEATMRVNALATPEALTTYSDSYNEILVLEKGKEETYMDESIPELQRIALYCIDNISQEAINEAKKTNSGIILVHSKKYNQVSKDSYGRNGYNESHYNYFNGSYEREIHEEVRR